MRYYEILREYNEAKLLNDFGAKLVAHFKKEFPRKKTSPEQLIQAIATADPTPNKELTFWLCLNYAKDGIQRWEDIGRAVEALQKFKALLRKPNLTPPLQIRDINQIKGLPALEDIVETYKEKDVQSNSEIADKEEQNFYKTGKAQLVLNTSQAKVVIPKTKEASKFFGKGTRWCTAAEKNNMFSTYNKQGPLYIVMIKGTKEKYQFHFETEQFMDVQDKEIDIIALFNKYPVLLDVFCPNTNKSLDIYSRLAGSD